MKKFVVISSLIVFSTVGMLGCVTEHLVQEAGKTTFRVDDGPNKHKAAEGRVNIALRLLQEGQATLAKQNLEKALEFEPDNFNAQLAYAWYYQTVGENENAYKAYNSLMGKYPNNGDIYTNYAIFLCSQNKYNEAYKLFEQAVTIPKFTRIAESLYEAGHCAYVQGDDQKAISYIDRSLAYNSVTPLTLTFRAELALGVDDIAKARAMMNRFSKYSDDNSYSLFIKLRIEEGSGNTEKAREYGEKLLQYYPNSREAQKYRTNDY